MGVDPGEIYSPGARAGGRPLNAANFRFDAETSLLVGSGGLRQKARDNFAAIELSQLLDREARPATEEEKRVLVRYVGWGGIPQVFASWQEAGASDWSEERQTIERLLTPAQYEAARASTLNAHYTAPAVVSAMYEAVERLGFTGGRVLEPALGELDADRRVSVVLDAEQEPRQARHRADEERQEGSGADARWEEGRHAARA